MHSYTPLNSKQRQKALLLAVAGFLVLVGVAALLMVRIQMKSPVTSPDFKKVSAVSGSTITLSIKTDAAGPYFEHNGEKISLSNPLQGLKKNTEYTLEIINMTTVPEGLFLPSGELSILVSPGQSDNKNRVTFSNSGTFVFLPLTYYPGWEQMKSAFVVSD